MLRLINICVIAALVAAAANVYRIKFESTVQAERVNKVRAAIRGERDAIATLRAEWTRLDNPARVQSLASRHLPLKQFEAWQVDQLDGLPDRPPDFAQPGEPDPIGAMIETLDHDLTTGSIKADGDGADNASDAAPDADSGQAR